MVFPCRRNGNCKVCLQIADGSILSGRFMSNEPVKTTGREEKLRETDRGRPYLLRLWDFISCGEQYRSFTSERSLRPIFIVNDGKGTTKGKILQ